MLCHRERCLLCRLLWGFGSFGRICRCSAASPNEPRRLVGANKGKPVPSLYSYSFVSQEAYCVNIIKVSPCGAKANA